MRIVAWSAVRTHIRLSFLEIASADRAAMQNKKLSENFQKVFCLFLIKKEKVIFKIPRVSSLTEVSEARILKITFSFFNQKYFLNLKFLILTFISYPHFCEKNINKNIFLRDN